MLVSLNWLTDYVAVAMSTEALTELLMGIGLNIDGVKETDSDIVLDVEVTSNRPDCLGYLGIAREIAAATGTALKLPEIRLPETSGCAKDLTRVDVLDPDLCPRYTARIIRGVNVGPSPAWLVERLDAVGMRSVNNVVDVTNFILMEYSQPLHSFDLAKLAEGRIVVRRANPGETMTAIDGTECQLTEAMLVIADARQPVAVAGVMGGLSTEVGDSTVDLLIESAQFDPLTTRRTSRALQLMSESNYRFERGIDPVGIETASARACQLIVELAGGTLAEGMVDVWATPHQPKQVAVRPARTCKIIGLEILAERQIELLERLGLSPQARGEEIVCTIPPFRADLAREIDLIEEIARLTGYDHIPVADAISHPVSPPAHEHTLRRKAASVLAAAGFDETVTFAFVDAAQAAAFGTTEPVCVDPLTRKAANALRPTLLPSLLTACKTNQDVGNTDVRLYELAAVFPPRKGQLPAEHHELAMVSSGPLRDLRGAVEVVLESLAPVAEVALTPGDSAGLTEGLAAVVTLEARPVGTIGMVAPKVLEAWDLEHPLAAATIDFSAILAVGGGRKPYQPVPRFPSIRRDLSVIVDESLTWVELSGAIAAVDQPLRAGAEYVTTYRGQPIDADKKSVTLTLTYRWDEGTLRNEQVDEQVAAVLSVLAETFGAQLRQ